MNCTRCSGTGFLNLDQLPDHVDQSSPEAILDYLIEYHAERKRVGGCSCHISPPCSFCTDAHDVAVCDCCGDGESHYGVPGEHYGPDDPKGPHGPYAGNGGLCQCH